MRLYNGNNRNDRTGVGTKSLFGLQLTFDLKEEFEQNGII
jgi:thymidylate synthase